MIRAAVYLVGVIAIVALCFGLERLDEPQRAFMRDCVPQPNCTAKRCDELWIWRKRHTRPAPVCQ